VVNIALVILSGFWNASTPSFSMTARPQLDEGNNMFSALKKIIGSAPKYVIIKKARTARFFRVQKVLHLPGLPNTLRRRPTGAGDSFVAE